MCNYRVEEFISRQKKDGGGRKQRGHTWTIFNSNFPRCVRLLCLQGNRMSGCKTCRGRAEEEVAEAWREKDLGEVSTLQQETLQSAFNHSRPLLRRPSRQRGGQQQSQVLPPLPSDNNSVSTPRNTIIYLCQLRSHKHTHGLWQYNSQWIRNTQSNLLTATRTIKKYICVDLQSHWL